MNLAPEHRLVWFAASLTACAFGWSAPQAQSNAEPMQTPQDMLAGITMHAPDVFYDPPAEVPNRPGVLLRSEPLTVRGCHPTCAANEFSTQRPSTT
jgi:hypothetical protein